MAISVSKILLLLCLSKGLAENSKFNYFDIYKIIPVYLKKLGLVKVKWRFSFCFSTVIFLESSFDIVEEKQMIGTFMISPTTTLLGCIMSCINKIGCHAVNVISNHRNKYIICQLITESCKPHHMINNINSTTYFRCKYYGNLAIDYAS